MEIINSNPPPRNFDGLVADDLLAAMKVTSLAVSSEGASVFVC